ncbi:mucin-17-like isoform X1 [Phascolarctos cinereus]
MEFTKDLENTSSDAYKSFAELFKTQMDTIFQNVSHYVGVEIKKLSNGSILVEYDVILSTSFTPDYMTELETSAKKVEETITTVIIEQGDTNCTEILCFNPNETSVDELIVSYDPLVECQETAGEFKEFFYIDYKDETPECINRCMQGFNSSLDCNQGKCLFQQSGSRIGPRCFCFTTDTHWYWGETCDFSTSKNLVYGLVGTLGAVLVLTIVALSVFMYMSRRKIQRQKARLDQVYKWHEEDGGPAPGSFQNTGFDICEEPEDSLYMDSTYSNFQPSLDHIDPEKKVSKSISLVPNSLTQTFQEMQNCP